MAEKLELVTDFGSLRAGMIAFVKHCEWCEHSHRGILLGPHLVTFVFEGKDQEDAMAFDLLPVPVCVSMNPSAEGYSIDADEVAQRNIYRVVDPLLEKSTESRKSVSA